MHKHCKLKKCTPFLFYFFIFFIKSKSYKLKASKAKFKNDDAINNRDDEITLQCNANAHECIIFS